MNLYDASIGPISHDFAWTTVYGNNGKDSGKKLLPGRVSFELRMSQKVRLEIKPTAMKFWLFDNVRDQKFNYSYQVISHSGVYYNSEFSEPVQVDFFLKKSHLPTPVRHNAGLTPSHHGGHAVLSPVYNQESPVRGSIIGNAMDFPVLASAPKNVQHILTRFPSSIAIELSQETPVATPLANPHDFGQFSFQAALSKIGKIQQINLQDFANVNKVEINWSYGSERSSPSTLEVEAFLDDIWTSSLKICLWALRGEKDINSHWASDDEDGRYHDEVVELEHNLVAECYMALSRILDISSQDYVSQEMNKKTNIVNKLWYHGLPNGLLICDYVLATGPFLRQMAVGVTTENGIHQSNTMFIAEIKQQTTSNHLEVHLVSPGCLLEVDSGFCRSRS